MTEAGEKKGLVPKLRFPEFEEEWLDTRIGEVCPFQRGFDLPSQLIEEGSVPVIYSNGVGGTHARAMAFGPGIVTGRSGTIGKIHYIAEGPYWPHNTTLWVTAFGCDPQFVFYLLGTFKIESYGTGSGVPTLNRNTLHEHRIGIPVTIVEQRKIAECLESLDELIAAETEKLEALKRHKKGLLQQLFPVEGETIPRLRFPQFRDTSEWTNTRLGEVCARIMDGTHFSPKSTQGEFMYITSKNIQNGSLDLSNLAFISEAEHEVIFRRCPVQRNDILLTKDGANTGNCAINTLDHPFSLLSSVAVLRGNAKLVDNSFIYFCLLTEFMQKRLRGSMSGQAITRITLEKINQFEICIPLLAEQQQIISCLNEASLMERATERMLSGISTHKASLMQQLFPSPSGAEA